MTPIISKRGRVVQQEADAKQKLTEKYQISQLPLSAEEQAHIHQVFENIKKQLSDIVKMQHA